MLTENQAPRCHGRPMLAVISRRTSANAYSRTEDTPVWWCADCHMQIKQSNLDTLRAFPDGLIGSVPRFTPANVRHVEQSNRGA